MTRIAVTGHRGLTAEISRYADESLRDALEPYARDGGLVGLSLLAEGADQLFARAILDCGGALEVVVPAHDYRDTVPEHAHASYDDLLGRAGLVRRLDIVRSSPTAYLRAGIAMLERADRLFAVWDGLATRMRGGTSDVVAHARGRGLPVTVFWPEGVIRTPA